MPESRSNVCDDCGQPYRPIAGHCHGGQYEGCCKSFRANRDFDQHRTGPFTARRCLTTQEMLEAGWECVGGYWASPGTVRDAQRARDPQRGLARIDAPEAVA